VKAGIQHARTKGKKLGRSARRQLTPNEIAEFRIKRRDKRDIPRARPEMQGFAFDSPSAVRDSGR
jgi:hypothetical protein